VAYNHCPPHALCDACLETAFSQMRGIAACRGESWSHDVARKVSREMPWPSFEGKAKAMAIGRVADMTRDTRLREKLAAELAAWAAKAWATAEERTGGRT
jgi:hypothetical protein